MLTNPKNATATATNATTYSSKNITKTPKSKVSCESMNIEVFSESNEKKKLVKVVLYLH